MKHHHHAPLGSTAGILKSEKGIHTLKVSLVILLATAALQAVVVFHSGSAALLADTFHNVADAFTAIPLWIAFALSRRRPTRSMTYGYGPAEDIAGVVIVFVVFGTAMLAGYESIQKLIANEPMTNHGWVIAASLIGFAGNEIVAVYRIRTGREIGSVALVADGQHSRVDGLTSLAVLFGAIGALVGFPQADPIVGILITFAILWIVFQTAREVLKRLMDVVDPKLLDEVETVARDIDGVTSVHDIRARWVGHDIHIDLSIAVEGSRSVSDGHEIAKAVHLKLITSIPHLSNVSIHVDPSDQIGAFQHDLKIS